MTVFYIGRRNLMLVSFVFGVHFTLIQHSLTHLLLFTFQDLDIGVEHSAVDFVGNGYVGVDSNGEMRYTSFITFEHYPIVFRFSTNNSRVLDLPTGFYPFVQITSDAAVAESLLTDFKNGVIKRIQCFLVVCYISLVSLFKL